MISGKVPSGLQYAVKRSGNAAAYCSLSIKVGTRDEEGYHSGIAHFIEHCIFKGTKQKSSSTINNYLERLGGELNAFTTKEEIVLHSTVLKEDYKKALSLLLELAFEATFPENEIQKEKGVVIDEIMAYKDSPSEDIYDSFEEKLFAGHPLSRPILGTVSSVSLITSEELRRFTKEKFRPEMMAITIVADVSEHILERETYKILSRAHAVFAKAPSSATTAAAENTREPVTLCGKRFEICEEKNNNQVNVVIGNVAPSLYEDRARYASVLLCNILGGPSSNSILNEVLRERNGWVYSVESCLTPYSDTGIMTISLGCDKENLEKCLRAVRKEILKLQTVPLSDRKLKASKRQLLGQLAISSDNRESECLGMGKSLLAYGKITPDETVRKKIGDITAEEIREIACRVLDLQKLSQLVFV